MLGIKQIVSFAVTSWQSGYLIITVSMAMAALRCQPMPACRLNPKEPSYFTGKACRVSPLLSFVFRGNMDSFRCLWHTSGTAPLALFPFSAMVTVCAFIHFRIPPVSGFAFLCSPVNNSKAASFGTNIFVMAFIVGHVFCQPDYCFRAFFFLLHTGSA